MKISRLLGALCLSFLLGFANVSLADGHQININTATVAEIASHLDGVGPVKAQAIVALREQLGGFTNLEQLLQVKGIGNATIERIGEQIVLE